MSAPAERRCWCGHPHLEDYSDDYRVCKACGTLVSRFPTDPTPVDADRDEGELYSKDYWLKRQSEHHQLPDIHARARLDLPERCTHWLRHLLERQLPPARVLEVGCAHGGYLALLKWAGFDPVGTEMSPWVVDFARQQFAVDVRVGTVEQQKFVPACFDVIVINDVIEHLPEPATTLAHCAQLLTPNGFFVIQTPEYKEHLAYADLVASNDLFLKHMDHNNDEHLYLFSRRSVASLFGRPGFGTLEFANPVYSYDMMFTASRRALSLNPEPAIATALEREPPGRLVQALLDKAHESTDRWWALQRAQAANRP